MNAQREYLQHVTREGERWDSIAYAYYGDAFAFEAIIAANPQVPITPALPAGVVLNIPLLDDAPDAGEAPPWKR